MALVYLPYYGTQVSVSLKTYIGQGLSTMHKGQIKYNNCAATTHTNILVLEPLGWPVPFDWSALSKAQPKLHTLPVNQPRTAQHKSQPVVVIDLNLAPLNPSNKEIKTTHCTLLLNKSSPCYY